MRTSPCPRSSSDAGYRKRCTSRKLIVSVSPAAAYDQTQLFFYFSGNVSSGEFRTATACGADHYYESAAEWGTSSAYGTVAIIAPGGTWIANARTNTGNAFTGVSPSNPDANKILCKNSTDWQITVSYTCTGRVAYAHSGFCI
jgi:hypothetical protein